MSEPEKYYTIDDWCALLQKDRRQFQMLRHQGAIPAPDLELPGKGGKMSPRWLASTVLEWQMDHSPRFDLNLAGAR